jgi:hypothetical protein
MSWCPQAFPEGKEADPVPAGGSPQLCCEEGGGSLSGSPLALALAAAGMLIP